MNQLVPTQLQLTHAQRAALGRVAFSNGRTISEIAREAIDAYLGLQSAPAAAGESTEPAEVRSAPRFQPAGAASGSWNRA